MVVPPKLSIFSKIGFHHEKPEVFVTTQWTRDARKSVWFLLFQWLLAAFYIGTISYGFYGFYDYLGYWLIYLTNWGVVLCTVATTSAAVLTTLYHFDCIELTPQSSSYKVVWLLSNVSTVLAFQITIIYWALLHNGIDSLNNFLIHAGNSAGMLLQLLVVRYPMYFAHVIHTVGLALIYGIFNLAYVFAGGTDFLGNSYIYPILKWTESPGKSALISLGVAVLMLLLHVTVCFAQKLRHRLHKKIFSAPTSFDLFFDRFFV